MLRNLYPSCCIHGRTRAPSAYIAKAVFPAAKNSQALRSLLEGSNSCQVRSPQSRGQRMVVLCSSGGSHKWDEHDADYVEAFVLDSEILRHQKVREQGLSGAENILHRSEEKESEADHISSIEYGLLCRFLDPHIFLRISCNSNLVLPIRVGEFAVEKLIDASYGDEKGLQGRPDQFQLMRNIVGMLGYEVRMVRITEKVVTTFYARIFLGKPGDNAMFSVDARPSDAINLAKRCKVPIYVNKTIVAVDTMKLVHRTAQTSGKWKRSRKNLSYDLSLDSAAEGPDVIAEELNLVRNMLIAVVEERYKDAALWRDKLNKLRRSKQEF